MGFDFAAAEKSGAVAAVARKKSPLLAAIVLGPSSGGKSYLIGTLGVKTLYLHTSGEEHGVDSAAIEGDKLIVPVCANIDEKGAILGPDATFKRLLAILSDVDGIKAAGFKAVALDSLTELEQLVRRTSQWKLDCVTKEGGHNNFGEPAATVKGLSIILEALRLLQREAGVHYLVPCLLNVKAQDDETGEVTDSEPNLLGYLVAATIVPQFPEQLVVGRMLSPEGKQVHRLQFMAGVSKTSVDQKTKEIKKYTNFTPRLRGVDSDKLPRHMKADLREVMKLKNGETK